MIVDDCVIDLENAAGYRRFICFALRYADCIGISYTSDFSAFKESRWWEFLGGSVIKYEYDESGKLNLFLKIDHITVEWLKGKKDIFDFWQTDDEEFLWDLCLYKDGREFFTSITHEKLSYISEEMWQKYNTKAR